MKYEMLKPIYEPVGWSSCAPASDGNTNLHEEVGLTFIVSKRVAEGGERWEPQSHARLSAKNGPPGPGQRGTPSFAVSVGVGVPGETGSTSFGARTEKEEVMLPRVSVFAGVGLLLLALLWRPAGTDWVEIPLHLKPSSSGPTTTARPSVHLGHSQLLSHLSTDRETSGGLWPSASTIRRWQPISDLLDYGDSAAWSSTERSRPGGVAMVNVSSKVEPWQPDDEDNGEQEEYEEQEEPVQTELLPFGNRYEEESIEASAASGESHHSVADHHAERPTQEHFDDFDDYDERMSAQQQQQQHQQLDETDEDELQTDGTSKLTHERRKPIRVPSGLGGFVDFLRRMQANFVLRTAHTIGDKIRTLAGLRDQLLSSIERRIAALWVAPGRQRRRVKRGWLEPHAGADAMDFPSAEGALLTISFLTFAVFLIKLVLQVINTIKAKHYTYSTFAAATPVSGGVLVKRVRRLAGPGSPMDVGGHHYAAILSAINSYQFT
uniref:Uncharacterized protein n=1 Tax=Anopheles atroparvus TaxID=41427 RepID=A0A182IMI4_ANOAO